MNQSCLVRCILPSERYLERQAEKTSLTSVQFLARLYVDPNLPFVYIKTEELIYLSKLLVQQTSADRIHSLW